MPPLGPSARTASSASPTSGRTPIAATTRSPATERPSDSTTPVSSTSATPTPVSTAVPSPPSPAAPSTASSGSSTVSTWGAASTTVVRMPRCDRFSAVSSPTNPAPITTAQWGVSRARRAGAPPRALHGPEHGHAVEAGERRPDRRRTRAEDEAVVAELDLLPAARWPQGDRPQHGVDGDDLGVHPDVEAKALVQALRRHQQQVLLVLNHAADVVGQATVGVGDVTRAFDHGDRGLLVKPPQPGGARHPSGHATDDHDPASAHRSSITPGRRR